jgi:hypothetical protein
VADTPPAGGKKILGMPRTTGIVVLVIGAAVIGYFVVSKLGGSKSTSTGSGSGGGGGRPSYAGGGTTIVRIIKGHQGHHPRPKPKPRKKGK